MPGITSTLQVMKDSAGTASALYVSTIQVALAASTTVSTPNICAQAAATSGIAVSYSGVNFCYSGVYRYGFDFANNYMVIGSGARYAFSSTTTADGAPDICFTRSAAGRAALTDGAGTTVYIVAGLDTGSNSLIKCPNAASGAGNTLTVYGSDAGNGNTNGGSLYARPGLKAGSGADGQFIVGRAGGSAGTQEIRIYEDATNGGRIHSVTTHLCVNGPATTGIVFAGPIGGETFAATPDAILAMGVPLNFSAAGTSGSQTAGIKKVASGVIGFTDGSTGSGGISSVAKTNSLGSSNLDNYASGVGMFQRWTAGAAIDVTGVVAGQDGEVRYIWNHGSNTITLKNDVTSTAANRWLTTTGADLALAANKCALAIYDATTQRWRVSLLP